MGKAKSSCSFLLCTTSILLSLICAGTVVNGNVESNINNSQKTARKLFVFGDSYADTGNLGNLGDYFTTNWYAPYGMSTSNKPTGRFSDGRVLTDFVAGYMGIKTPIAYKYRKLGKKMMSYGMNFATGGAGVFDTIYMQNNLTVQINHFQAQINEGLFSKSDIESSVALVVISGNDYSTLKSLNPDFLKVQHIVKFMDDFFTQLSKDIQRLESLGVRKVIITNMHPLSCTPKITRSNNYTSCPSDLTDVVAHHNMRFLKMAKSLNEASKHKLVFPLDIFTAITNILHQVNTAPKFEYPLVPCCAGITDSKSCGQANEDRTVKYYTLCKNPSQHFYWDTMHPTQAGWNAVFKYLEPSLGKAFRAH